MALSWPGLAWAESGALGQYSGSSFRFRGRTRRAKFDSGTFFEGPGVIVIPVNEYFDGELGDHVSETSLHGRLIKDVLAGQSKIFVDLASQALEGVTPEESGVERSSGSRDRYAIGTVARVDLNDQRYLLAALSRTDLSSLKASCHGTRPVDLPGGSLEGSPRILKWAAG